LDLPPERVHQLVAEFEQLIAAELNHPAAALPLATGITGVSAYLAQDYVAAESLDLAVREYGAAPPADALRVAVQLAGALDLAAVANVNHGALHPRDVLLSDDETRVTGIGVARALERVGIATPVRRPYAPPERRTSGAWSRQADVFSLATLVHELLWGRRIAAEGDHVADSLTDLPGARPKLLRAAFIRALAERPEDRFDCALEFAEALKAAFPDVQLSEPAPSKRRAAVRKKEPVSTLPLEASDRELPPAAPDPKGPEPTAEAPRAAAAEESVPPEISPAPLELLEPPESREPFEPREPSEPRELPEPVFSAAVMEQTRSAVWPLMAALVIGLAIGFAGGYGVGTTGGHAVQSVNEAQTASPAPAGRDTTEIAVTPSPSGAPASFTPPARPRAPDRRNASRTQPERPPARPTERSAAAPVPAGTSGALVGRLSIESRPSGARVFLDNNQIGVTPLAKPDIKAGEHAIRLERDGYRHWTSTVRIAAGEQNRVTASLDK
jgi:serine/threonine protein kinase